MKLKWDVSGKGDDAWGSGNVGPYEGDVPPAGSYVARIKRMTVHKIKKEGENQGKPRLAILLEIVSGAGANGLDDPDYQYLGAPVWDSLNIIKNQTGKINGFLHALTDGSDAAKRAVETAFWPPNGPKAEKEARRDGTEDVHIKEIGAYKINSPNGQHLVRVITKMGSGLDGSPRAEVNSYIPYTGPKPVPQAAATNGKVEDDDVLDVDIVEDDESMDAGDFIESTDDAVELDEVDAPPF